MSIGACRGSHATCFNEACTAVVVLSDRLNPAGCCIRRAQRKHSVSQHVSVVKINAKKTVPIRATCPMNSLQSQGSAKDEQSAVMRLQASGDVPGIVQGRLTTDISPSISFPGGILAVCIIFIIASIGLVVATSYFTAERFKIANKLLDSAQTHGLAAAIPTISSMLGVQNVKSHAFGVVH